MTNIEMQQKIKETNEAIAFIELKYSDGFIPGTTKGILKQYKNSLDEMIEEFDKTNKKDNYIV
jgi:hypothetical protein